MVYVEFGGKQSVLWAIGKQRIQIYAKFVNIFCA